MAIPTATADLALDEENEAIELAIDLSREPMRPLRNERQGNVVCPSGQSPKAATTLSSSAQMRLSSLLLMPVSTCLARPSSRTRTGTAGAVRASAVVGGPLC